MKGNYLITTNEWFFAPDGRQYRGVWGNVEIVSDSILGIKTNARSANWFAKIGSENNHVLVAGCQIHYAVRCEQKPYTGITKDFSVDAGKVTEYERLEFYYITEN